MDTLHRVLSILSDKDQYNVYNLNNNDLYEYAIVFTVILLIYCVASYALMSDNKKRLAWMVSLVNSFLLSIIGIVYIINKSSYVLDTIQATVKYDYRHVGRPIYHDKDNVSVIVCLWFAIANIIDLIFGFIFYQKEQGLITSYIHHTIFIWIMFTCTTGNGIFLKCTPFAPAFLFMCIEEIPTFLLALGSVIPSLRTDIGFGFSFFIFRILYHILFFVYAIYVKADAVVCFLYLLTLLMHINWFSSWVTKYGKKIIGKKKK